MSIFDRAKKIWKKNAADVQKTVNAISKDVAAEAAEVAKDLSAQANMVSILL